MKIGILLCDDAGGRILRRHGTSSDMFQTLLAGRGLTFRTFDVVNMQFPDSIHDCEGWLLTGSRFDAYSDEPFVLQLGDFIRDVYAASVPMVGICFGHQIIAHALGGHVEKFEGGRAVGFQTYQFDDLGEIHANALHQDQVITAPDDARLIGSSSFCKNAALVYGNKALTMQPHPEFSNEIIASYLEALRGRPGYPDALMDDAAAQLDRPIDADRIADQIADFFTKSRGR
ncbi:MAG: type 1 glutamine amidotransferase [Marinosulfonomonas sp.]|nr:type 1 glutamine amidotransferase [Marinosulfonomonas sp.]